MQSNLSVIYVDGIRCPLIVANESVNPFTSALKVAYASNTGPTPNVGELNASDTLGFGVGISVPELLSKSSLKSAAKKVTAIQLYKRQISGPAVKPKDAAAVSRDLELVR